MINRAVEDIGTVHARLARAVVVFTRPPEGEEWGGLVATFADPDGNTLQLLQLPDGTAPPKASARRRASSVLRRPSASAVDIFAPSRRGSREPAATRRGE